MFKIYYTWGELDEDIKSLHNSIARSGFVFDCVVGVARGGCVPAIMVSHALDLPYMSMDWSLRDWDSREVEKIKTLIDSGKRYLIVDDIVDSGETLKQLLEFVNESNNFKFASLVYNSAQPIEPDFWARSIDRRTNNSWIVFPWEK